MPKAIQLLTAFLVLAATGCSSNGGGGNGGSEFDPVVRAAPDARLSLEVLGRWDGGFFSTTAANNPPAYDPETERLFVIHSIRQAIEILDISDPDDPEHVADIDLLDLADDLQVGDLGPIRSVAFDNGVLAIALASRRPGGRGIVAFYDARGRELVDPVRVGVGPNAMAFTPDGQNIVLVNSGTAEEPEEDEGENGIDPEGSISIIRVGPRDRQDLRPTVTNIGFEEFNAQRDALIAAGVRIYGPGATVAQDLEPESLAISPDSRTAWATLQRNNALAVLDIPSADVTSILPLGTRSFNAPGQGIDASDEDGAINIRPWPVQGFFSPDGIGAYTAGEATFLVTANEGDPRPFEDVRVRELTLDPADFPNASELREDRNLGRLRVTNVNGDTDRDGDFDQLFTLGTRSFSTWTAAGQPVFDSGDAFERIMAETVPAAFNTPDDATEFDATSSARGPEPEPLAVGEVDGRQYAFIAFERIGGVIVYDITDPAAPRFQFYINNRNFAVDPDEVCLDNLPKRPACAAAGDLGPESVLLIPATRSPISRPLLVLVHEVSDSTTIFRIDPAPGS